MAYWRELPENFTSGWDLSQISATNLMLPIATKKQVTRKCLDQNRGKFFKKNDTYFMNFELGSAVYSHDRACMTLYSGVVMPFKGQRLRNCLLETTNEYQLFIKSLSCNSCNKHKNNMQTSLFLSIKHVFVMGWINQLCCRGSRLQGVMYICIRTHLALLLRLLSFSLMKVPQYPFTLRNWLYTY